MSAALAAVSPQAPATEVREAVEALRRVDDPELERDLELLGGYLDLVADLAEADLDDPDALTEAEARLAEQESQLAEATVAAKRVQAALSECEDDG